MVLVETADIAPLRASLEADFSTVKSPEGDMRSYANDESSLQHENAELKRQVATLSAQLHRAQGVFSQYLPMFSVDMDTARPPSDQPPQ